MRQYFQRLSAPCRRCSRASRCAPALISTWTRRARRLRPSACARSPSMRFWPRTISSIIVNLTIPAAHFEVSRRVFWRRASTSFSEKPFVLSVDEGHALLDLAASKGLRVGSAPDTFLGGAHQQARALWWTAASWGKLPAAWRASWGAAWRCGTRTRISSSSPAVGPFLDIGPYYVTNLVQLIGSGERAWPASRSTPRTRSGRSPAQPRARASSSPWKPPPPCARILEFATAARPSRSTRPGTCTAHGLAPMELYGEKGSIFVPDPNFFGGESPRHRRRLKTA